MADTAHSIPWENRDGSLFSLLLELHPDVVVVDEFDAVGFKSFPQYFEGAFVRRPGFALEVADSGEADGAAVGQVCLLPLKECARGAALSGGNHVRI